MAFYGSPTVRVEICEGTNVGTCRAVDSPRQKMANRSRTRGYDAWREFGILVKPSETAVLTSQRILTEDFESGLGGWEADGLVRHWRRSQI
jgi:hypothetical protein